MSNLSTLLALEQFTTFGDLLKYLRRRAGLTQRELSIAVGYSHGQISRLELNDRLPDVATITARFVPALGLESDPPGAKRLLELAAAVRREDAPAYGVTPYKGLRYFDEADSDLFFGREALTARLAERLLSIAASEVRFLAVVGASGSGKSSVVRAGLIPTLRWRPETADWLIHSLTPTSRPLQSLAASLTQDENSVATTSILLQDLEHDPQALHLFTLRRLSQSEARTASARISRRHWLLVIDQFEELFTLCRSETERRSFIDGLLTAASEPGGSVCVLLTLRADFYAHCAPYAALRAALAEQQDYIGPMSADELRCAIEEPARRGGWDLEPGLCEVLLKDLGAEGARAPEPGALPLLSHALLETWQRRRGRTLTLSGYLATGGVRGAIAETAEAVFHEELDDQQRTIARAIFLRLTEMGEDDTSAETRRRASLEELVSRPEEQAAVREVLTKLADARLITTDQGMAEVAHEALIREWPTLRNWLDENRDGLRLHRHLTLAAESWLRQGHEAGELYRGARLAQALEWSAAHAATLNPLEREFLLASQAHTEREAADREAQRQRELQIAQQLAASERQRASFERQAAVQLRRRAVWLAGALLLALVLAAAAFVSGNQARQSTALAQTAQAQAEQERLIATVRELAAAAMSNLTRDAERSLLLSLEAVAVAQRVNDRRVLYEAEAAVHQAVLASHARLSWQAHTGHVWVVAFSPDGKRLATAGQDGAARVWDAATGELLMTLSVEGEGGPGAVAFSPDGAWLAASSDAGKVRIWDAATGQLQLTLAGHTQPVWGLAFSPDGARLATGGHDGRAIVWEVFSGRQVLVVTDRTDAIIKVAFSPDGELLATSPLSTAGHAQIWAVASGEPLIELNGQGALAFSPSGQHLATTSAWDDTVLQVWNTASGAPEVALTGHTSGIFNVAYSPDGAHLATVGRDRTARVWEASTGRNVLTLTGHVAAISGLAFSPDGHRLATGDDQGYLRVWGIGPDQEVLTATSLPSPAGRRHELLMPAFSPDGTQLFALRRTTDGMTTTSEVVVQQLGDETGLQVLAETSGAPFESLALSPDGHYVAVGDQAGNLHVWDALTGQRLNSFEVEAPVLGLAFSPDGQWLAAPKGEGPVLVWNPRTGENFSLSGHGYLVLDLVFGPEGSWLATASVDRTVKLWNLVERAAGSTLRGHTAAVLAVAFSPDGTRLATSSLDGVIQVWDAATGQSFQLLTGHAGPVTDLAFSPDNARLASVSDDATLRLWEVATGQTLLMLPGAGRVAFSPDGAYLATTNPQDASLRVYAIDGETLIQLARSRLTRSLTPAECQQYLHVERCP